MARRLLLWGCPLPAVAPHCTLNEGMCCGRPCSWETQVTAVEGQLLPSGNGHQEAPGCSVGGRVGGCSQEFTIILSRSLLEPALRHTWHKGHTDRACGPEPCLHFLLGWGHALVLPPSLPACLSGMQPGLPQQVQVASAARLLQSLGTYRWDRCVRCPPRGPRRGHHTHPAGT